MIACAEGFLVCMELGKFVSRANLTNVEGSCSSNSARKTGTTGIFSILFLSNAHSYLCNDQQKRSYFIQRYF